MLGWEGVPRWEDGGMPEHLSSEPLPGRGCHTTAPPPRITIQQRKCLDIIVVLF